MTALPTNVPFDSEGISVWDLLLSAEEAANNEVKPAAKYRDHLVAVRVLGFFLLDFYNRSGFYKFGIVPYKHLLLEVKSCFNVPVTGDQSQDKAVKHTKIFELGLRHRNNLLRIFRSHTGLMQMPSSHPSQPSFDQARLEMIKSIEKADKTMSDVRSAALLRDGFKCLITGGYDVTSYNRYPEIRQEADAADGTTISAQCAHLFTESAQAYEMFGLEHEAQKLLGGKINSLSNVLTLRYELHHAFSHFGIWLEEEPGQVNTYKVIIPEDSQPGLLKLSPPPAKRVTFSVNPDCAAFCKKYHTPLPELPSRDLIAIRAACARVAHMSGAVEQIDQIHREEKDTTVLAHDGSMGSLLTSLLNARAVSFCA